MVNYDNLSGAEQIPEVAGTWRRRGAALRGRCLGLPPESRCLGRRLRSISPKYPALCNYHPPPCTDDSAIFVAVGRTFQFHLTHLHNSSGRLHFYKFHPYFSSAAGNIRSGD